jgi:predicted nucleic acid-binding protein
VIALDSSAWIERWVRPGASERILREIRGRGGDPARLVVPATVVFETERWLIRSLESEQLVDEYSAMLSQHDLVPIDDTLARYAALTSVATGLAHADAMILAAARSRHATLLTFDTDFAGIPDVVVLDR